jgi:hypothetical protein
MDEELLLDQVRLGEVRLCILRLVMQRIMGTGVIIYHLTTSSNRLVGIDEFK